MSRENVERLREAFEGSLRREPRAAQLWAFRDGLVVHWKLYDSQSEALAAAGVSG